MRFDDTITINAKHAIDHVCWYNHNQCTVCHWWGLMVQLLNYNWWQVCHWPRLLVQPQSLTVCKGWHTLQTDQWIVRLRIVAKALDGQRYQCPAYVGCGWSWEGSRAAALKGSMTYAFTHIGNFILLLLPPSSRLRFWPRLERGPLSWDLGLLAEIWASTQEYVPWGWDLSVKAGIWALRLGLGLCG